MKVFGKASEFYRARLINIEDLGVEKLDWHDDILYQEPKRMKINPKSKFLLQVITTDGNEIINQWDYKSKEEAGDLLLELEEDVCLLTKNEFDDKYLARQSDNQ